MAMLLSKLRKLAKDRSGSYMALSGLLFPFVIALAGVGIDVMSINNARRDLQYIADSAAYEALNNAERVPPTEAVSRYVSSVTENNEWRNAHPSILGMRAIPYLDGRTADLKVTIIAQVHTPFLSMLRQSSKTTEVISVAHSECLPYRAKYLGNAFLNDQNEYVMTEDKKWQQGWVWLHNRWDMTQRQDIKLKLYFGKRDRDGADGMAFAIHNDKQGFKAMGHAGESLGLAWHPSYPTTHVETSIVAPALVVEFDTWRNSAYDMAQDHTAVFKLGNKEHDYNDNNAFLDHRKPNQIMKPHALPNIEDGKYHFARFIWDPDTSSLAYYFDGDLVKEIRLDLIDFLGSKTAILGFSASTGGARNEHKACFFQTKLVS